MPTKKKVKDIYQLLNKLQAKQQEAREALQKTYPKVEKYLKKTGLDLDNLREKSSQMVSLAALSATVFLSSPSDSLNLPIPKEIVDKLKTQKSQTPKINLQNLLTDLLSGLLPQHPRPLSQPEEAYLENLAVHFLGIKAKATFENQHLNTTYGLIGAEQHLRRYPGDSVLNHGDTFTQTSGMAPGKGAWGYFAASKDSLTPELEATEKWYAVVQTMYLPEWNTNTKQLRDWYKYRKIVIINTLNGNSVIAKIADAGPAAWTGKHFGGSPEVMHALGGSRYKKGPVVVLFVEDPDDKLPLGQLDYNQNSLSELALKTIYE